MACFVNDERVAPPITYRIALGPQQGRKAFTLQTVPAVATADDNSSLAKGAGSSLHAGVASEADERGKRERLCRDITRPAVSTERLSLTAQGNIRYRLKTAYRDGTTDVVFEPLDFMALLAALVPTPLVNLPRYHGAFAPNHRLREQVTPARRGRHKAQTPDEPAPARHVAMTWAQRLKRVLKIDIETCEHCRAAVKEAAPAHPARIPAQHWEHRRSGGDQDNPRPSRAARVQTLRAGAAAT